MNKKRGGPSHRVRKDDGYPLVNDWFEAGLVFLGLCCVFGGAYFFYAVSQ